MRHIDADAFKEYISEGYKEMKNLFFEEEYRTLAEKITKAFLDDIDEQPTVNQWIPIVYHDTTDEDGIDKDKFTLVIDCPMPEDGQHILVCDDYHAWEDICYYDDGWELDSGNSFVGTVIAWMPMPELYREEKQDGKQE